MNRIFILRHAKAGEHTTNDHDRPLTDVGHRQAHVLGKWFRDQNTHFDAVLSSSSLRTVETVESLGLSMGYTIVPRLYSAPAHVIESVIRESGIESGDLLIVAHNPGVSDLVLAAGSSTSMGTCAVVELACAQPLTEFSADRCQVVGSFRPEV
jgi:phosphohistidine phosphatase